MHDSDVADDSFDVALLFGPIHHLTTLKIAIRRYVRQSVRFGQEV